MMNIWELTKRPDPELFHKSHDPHDPRLGEIVKHHPQHYENSQVVILGCPQDEGVCRNKGRPGARKGPTEIRRALYKLTPFSKYKSMIIFDLGDLIISSSLEKTHSKQKEVVKNILAEDKLLIVLGGGNDISYPDCAALSEVEKDTLVFNIDKHFDVRDLSPRNSGTPYRLLLEENFIKGHRFYQMGSEEFSNSEFYKKYLHQQGAHVHSLKEMRQKGIKPLFQDIIHKHSSWIKAIFWGFDLDAVRSSDAPGVSASYPTGLTASEICEIAEIAGKKTSQGIVEFTEVNPLTDIDNRTSKLTAVLIHTFLSFYG